MPPVAHIVGEIFPAAAYMGMTMIVAIGILSWIELAKDARARRRDPVAALWRARVALMEGNFETGICCCGSPCETHGMGDGHSPVDEGWHYIESIVERIDNAREHYGRKPQ